MDLPSPHQASRGPMTRARARALETEVTSLLSDISYEPLETWLLPQSGMLCMIRYQEDPPADAHEDGQDPKSMEEKNQWNSKNNLQTPDIRPGPQTSGPWRSTRPGICRRSYRDRTSGVQPGHPAPTRNPAKIPNIRHRRPGSIEACHVSPDIRRSPRTSGASRCSGHPAPPSGHLASPIQRTERPSASARTSGLSARTSGASRATGHPARRPDIRTSQCLRARVGLSPCTPSPPS